MPLENAIYISQLVTSNPSHSDGLNQADAHLRLIKAAVNTNGVAILAEAGVGFKTNTGDGFGNPAAGEVDVVTGGAVAARFMATSAIVPGTIQATQGFLGAGTVPIGSMVMWFSDTLPSGAGVWAWANGQAISRTTYAAAYAIFGTTYGAGDGVTTFNLPNMQDCVPVGKDTMGGASSPGLLTSISTALKQVLGKIFGTDTATLTTANLPPYTPAGTITNGAISSNGQINGSYQQSAPQGGNPLEIYTGTPITFSQAASTFTGTAQGGTSAPFGNTQPSFVVNFIIRIA